MSSYESMSGACTEALSGVLDDDLFTMASGRGALAGASSTGGRRQSLGNNVFDSITFLSSTTDDTGGRRDGTFSGSATLAFWNSRALICSSLAFRIGSAETHGFNCRGFDFSDSLRTPSKKSLPSRRQLRATPENCSRCHLICRREPIATGAFTRMHAPERDVSSSVACS